MQRVSNKFLAPIKKFNNVSRVVERRPHVSSYFQNPFRQFAYHSSLSIFPFSIQKRWNSTSFLTIVFTATDWTLILNLSPQD